MTRKILAIESATDWLSVALLEGEEVIGVRRSEARMQHAAALLPAIDEVLSATDTPLGAIEAIAISTGPGSFTSLRIGLATVKGLAFRREVEAIGVSTLEAMALAGLEADGLAGDGPVLALLDARRGEWYAGGWKSGEGEGPIPEPALAEGLYAPDRIAAALSGGVRVVAPQPGAWLDAIEAAGIEIQGSIEGEAALPDAVWVGRLGSRRLEAGQGYPADRLSARYLRRAEAEAKLLGGPVEAGEIADLGAEDGAT